jgi:DNA-binding transcriptional MerR regulator
LTIKLLRDIINEKLRGIFRVMLHITECARTTGASVDELRYIERKGFINSVKKRIVNREVRQYRDSDLNKIGLIIKYRRQGFTWDTAYKKALEEMAKPSLFNE